MKRATVDTYRAWAETPNEEPPALSVVIPTYNEEWRIIPTIGAIAVELSQHYKSWELIVSDDGSTDGTHMLVKDLGLANLRLLEHPNTGKGGAVRRGIEAASGEYVLFADADQSTPIQQVGQLAEELSKGSSIAIGSRAADGAEVNHKSLRRRVLSMGLNAVVQLGYGLPVKDTQCGFKMFTKDAARHLFALQRIDGFSFDLEVLFLARRAGLTIAEVPVEWIDAPGSTVEPGRVAMQFLKDLVRIRWWAMTGRYSTSNTRAAAVSSKIER